MRSSKALAAAVASKDEFRGRKPLSMRPSPAAVAISSYCWRVLRNACCTAGTIAGEDCTGRVETSSVSARA